MALPWNAWLGAATVPEGWAGALVASAAIAMTGSQARGWAGTALFVASLSRYEAWPVCVIFAAVCGASALRSVDANRDVWRALLALAGPAAWMAWNAHAHDGPLHFLARVAAFRHAVGAADVPLTSKLLGYPVALVTETPEVALLGLVGLIGLRHRELRRRWLWPSVTAGVVMAFLVWGDVQDGAPTHHPARALGATWWLFVGMGVDTIGVLIAGPQVTTLAGVPAAGILLAFWCVSLPTRWAWAPGKSPHERRDAQIERGRSLRESGVEHARVVPCAYEHFALLAAWGAPERATVEAITHQPVTEQCPDVLPQ
jgi:hypothetical protein